jgi:hypothetical protein
MKLSPLAEFIAELEDGRRRRIRAIFREKQPPVLDFNDAPGARDGVLSPVRPFFVEKDILQAPYDECRDRKRLERGMNGNGLRVIEAKPISLERLEALRRGQ